MKRSIKLWTVLIALVSLCLVFASCDSGSDDPTPVLPDDPLSGVFTVDSSGTKVRFSKGNLQATIDATGVPTAWKFAENQFDCIGANKANTTIGSQEGTVDLFGWSTDGTGATTGYKPWGISTSDNASDYSGDFKDWGKAIGDGNTWHTLSKAEWMYLLNTRTVNGGTDERYSYQNAIINSDATGVYGMILYPDDYTAQTDATSYTSDEWSAMEAAGAVFLPAAGFRLGSVVSRVGNYGHYWSSTHNEFDPDRASDLYSVDSYVNPAGGGTRNYGVSVRLVCGE